MRAAYLITKRSLKSISTPFAFYFIIAVSITTTMLVSDYTIDPSYFTRFTHISISFKRVVKAFTFTTPISI